MIEIMDSVEHVSTQLDKYANGVFKMAGGNIHVICPFHDENTPSCSVNLDRSGDVPIGMFYCFGCGTKGNWNKFAKATDLVPLKDYQGKVNNSEGALDRAKSRRDNIKGRNNLTLKRLFDEVGNEVIPWPKSLPWRNYSGELVREVGGYCYNDKRQDALMLVLPVYINGKYRGGVRAYTKKRKGASYLTLKGDWVRSHGLLGYDYIREQKLWGCKALALVEGPRDWLRMMDNQIPACGILGALMFDAKKLQLLIGLGIKVLYVLSDNDSAGYSMYKLVKKHADAVHLKCIRLKLPKDYDEDGKLIKLDPDNADQEIIDEVKKLIYKSRPKKGSR